MENLQITSQPILFYEGPNYYLSNFSSFQVYYRGKLWPTSEHVYQAMKFDSPFHQFCVLQQPSAHEAMKYARARKELYRADWDDVKLQIMEDICRAKLHQHKYIQRKLLGTGDMQLIESSPNDSFWGWGPNKDGKNHLGRIWMALRDEWRSMEQALGRQGQVTTDKTEGLSAEFSVPPVPIKHHIRKIDRERLHTLYMAEVDRIADACDWKSNFSPREIIGIISDILETEQDLIHSNNEHDPS